MWRRTVAALAAAALVAAEGVCLARHLRLPTRCCGRWEWSGQWIGRRRRLRLRDGGHGRVHEPRSRVAPCDPADIYNRFAGKPVVTLTRTTGASSIQYDDVALVPLTD